MQGLEQRSYKADKLIGWEQKNVTILTPHAADHKWMFKTFPALKNYKNFDFDDYLRIEQDYGSTELAHQTAIELNKLNINVEILKTNYNRGLLDGGRQLEWALRSALPEEFRREFQQDLIDLHSRTVELISEKCLLTESEGGLVLDLHTMAPNNPVFDLPEHEFPTFENLRSYVDGFSKKNPFDPVRPIDILTEDENGTQVTDKALSQLIFNGFSENGYDVAFNKPYTNHSRYMMNHYLNIATGVAIDIPKHLIAVEKGVDFSLRSFELDFLKIKKLAKIIANALNDRLK